MATGKTKDAYPNYAFLEITQAGAGTIQFEQLQIANGLTTGEGKKYGLKLLKAEYFNVRCSAGIMGDGTFLEVALSVTPNLTTLGPEQPEIIDKIEIRREDYVDAVATLAAGSGMIDIKESPVVHDFSSMGGILVAADRLYVGVKGSAAAIGNSHKIRLWYTVVPLTSEEYWELIESRRIIST